MLTFRQLNIFETIMNCGSVSMAAEILHTSQPTVSRELARIEYLVGFQLFERQKGRLKPTQEALIIFKELKNSRVGLNRVNKLIDDLKQKEIGELSICCLPFLTNSFMANTIGSFCKVYKEISFTIVPLESPYIESDLSSQIYNLGLTEMDYIPVGTSLIQKYEFQEVCVVPMNHRLANEKCITPFDLEDENFISLAKDDPYRNQIDKIFEERKIKRKMLIETSNASSACTLVHNGLGISILNPITALEAYKQGYKIKIKKFSLPILFNISVIQPIYRPQSSLMEPFLQAIDSEFKKIYKNIDLIETLNNNSGLTF
ncbi:TPA: LysR family transcriptional regulator [Acinetobacter baumannii]|nr:LysR family transcriptional regulator [Acinetobacter baumannii]MDC5402427.1 LysR family transcriptional regulator [Acinetobacter baumannii]